MNGGVKGLQDARHSMSGDARLFTSSLHFELDSNPGREGGRESTFDMVISMKSLRILLNNTFTNGIEPLQLVLDVSSYPHLRSVYHIPPPSS